MQVCDLNMAGKRGALCSCGAGVKVSGTCESVAVNSDILHLHRQVWIHRTGTPTCVHTSTYSVLTDSLFLFL